MFSANNNMIDELIYGSVELDAFIRVHCNVKKRDTYLLLSDAF